MYTKEFFPQLQQSFPQLKDSDIIVTVSAVVRAFILAQIGRSHSKFIFIIKLLPTTEFAEFIFSSL